MSVAPVSPKRHPTDSRRHSALPRLRRGQSFRVPGGAPPEHLPNSEGGLVRQRPARLPSRPPATPAPTAKSHLQRSFKPPESQLQELQPRGEQTFPTSCQRAPTWRTGSQRHGPGTTAPRFLLRPAGTWGRGCIPTAHRPSPLFRARARSSTIGVDP